MPKFRYKALSQDGRIVEGEQEFPTLANLVDYLSRENLTLISAKKIEEKENKKGINLNIPNPFSGVSDRDWSLFCRQLSVLVGAGVGVVEALQLLAEQITNKKLKEALLGAAKLVEEGSSFTAALRKYSNVFPEFIINLVEVGEETGELDLVLRRAAEYYEKMAFIKGKVKSASFYPTFVSIIAVIIVGGILTFIVPQFESIYKAFGGELPLPTQMLINTSKFLRENFLTILGIFVGVIYLFLYLYKTNRGFKTFVHKMMLKAPKFGEVFKKSAMARFTRTMATLFSSGVPIERSLEISAKVVGLIPVEEAINQAKKDVLEGKTLWMSLEKTKMFPKMVIAMVKVGEESGRIDEMLNTIANFYEEEIDRLIEGLISLIEPMLIVFLGGIITLILIALYLPIFKIGELLTH